MRHYHWKRSWRCIQSEQTTKSQKQRGTLRTAWLELVDARMAASSGKGVIDGILVALGGRPTL